MKCTFYIYDITKVAHLCKLSSNRQLVSTALQNSIACKQIKYIDGYTWELWYLLNQIRLACSQLKKNFITYIKHQQKSNGQMIALRIHPPVKEVIDYKW